MPMEVGSSENPGRHVLLVGDAGHRDFREAVAWLEANTRLEWTPTPDVAMRRLAGPPDVLIVAQSRPGQFSARQLERLHAASPLSRLVALLGSWCEGEGRSGRPWPGVVRVLWHQWDARMIPELSGPAFPRSSVWSLPRTIGAADQFAYAVTRPRPAYQGLVAVRTPSVSFYRSLRDACRDAGYATAWLPPSQVSQLSGLSAVLWDGVACDAAAADEFRRQRSAWGDVPLVALLDFVRRDDRDRAVAAGVSAVLAKPFLLSDLLWHVEQAIRAARLPATIPCAA